MDSIDFGALFRAILILGIGFAVARFGSVALGRALASKVRRQSALIAERVAFYAVVAVTIASALRVFGVDLSVLLGAAGVLTVALGFAAQTSASNLISGVMLMAEQPFVVGDVISVGDRTGEVVSIDVLSVKIRTFENLLVRVPNETLLKSQITNLTHYPIRRADFEMLLGHDADLAKVRAILERAAAEDLRVLDEPKAQFFFDGYSPDGPRVRFCVWIAKGQFVEARSEVSLRLRAALQREGATLARPYRQVELIAQDLRGAPHQGQ